MESNSQHPYDEETDARNGQPHDGRVSVEQVQRLIRLLDRSDVSEVEIKRAEEGLRLVLRKARASESGEAGEYVVTTPAAGGASVDGEVTPVETKHIVTAPLVGIFHTWARPKGKALVSVGDKVKIGQLLGTIQSLNVINEVESPVAGRVHEILVQEGQAVEYGQQLMTIDNAEEA